MLIQNRDIIKIKKNTVDTCARLDQLILILFIHLPFNKIINSFDIYCYTIDIDNCVGNYCIFINNSTRMLRFYETGKE